MRRTMGVVAVFLLAAVATAAAASAAGLPLEPLAKETPRKGGAVVLGDARGALDCSGAIEVALDAVYHDTNVGKPNRVSFYGCSDWEESGGEVVYHLLLTEPKMFRVLIEPYGCDLDLAVLNRCDETLGCEIVADAGVITSEPIAGELFLVVDGYLGDACEYDLVVEELPPPASACGVLRQPVPGGEGAIVPGGVFTVEGNTCDGANLVSSLDCGTYTESGYEHWYELVLLPGAAFQFDLEHTVDGALWVLAACEDLTDADCLAFADENWPAGNETIYHQNDTGARERVFLVVDSYEDDSCGPYTGTLTIFGPGIIDTRSASWGAVKTLYR